MVTKMSKNKESNTGKCSNLKIHMRNAYTIKLELDGKDDGEGGLFLMFNRLSFL